MEDLRKIAEQKLRDNDKFRAEMYSLIASKEAIAFIGAGMSASLNYPTWQHLLRDFTTQANAIEAFTPSVAAADALTHAEEIQQFFKTRGRIAEFYSHLGRKH